MRKLLMLMIVFFLAACSCSEEPKKPKEKIQVVQVDDMVIVACSKVEE